MTSKLTSTILLLLLALPATGDAKPNAETRQRMQSVYASFKELQLYLAREDAFLSAVNEDRIMRSLKGMRDGFHALEQTDSHLHEEPGFAFNLRMAGEILEDSLLRFRDGQKSYALYQMKGVSSHCIGCHSTYRVQVGFHDAGADLSKLNFFQKGEFFFASRQFHNAELAYLAALADERHVDQHMPALRKWLLIHLRIYQSPSSARTQLEQLMQTVSLYDADREEAEQWLTTLSDPRIIGTKQGRSLERARTLVRGALATDEDTLITRTDPIKLILATVELHAGFDHDSFTGDARAEALYLLGVSYSRLAPFFIAELPETFLEQCIDEFPGSETAKKAYNLYRDVTMEHYGGIGGSTLPPDVNLKLRTLYDRAHDVVAFRARI